MEKSKEKISESNHEENLLDADKIFRKKGGKLYPIIPKMFIRYIEHITHQDELNDTISRLHDYKDLDFIDKLIENEFGLDVKVVNSENIPPKGRYIVASNHPLGGLDGIALMYAVGKKRKDINFLVNDILLEIRNLEGLFVPINKHGRNSYESVRIIETVYNSDELVLIFPAGLVSRRQKGKICDLSWKKSFITKAIRHKRDIIPVHIQAKNSNFFYNLANFRKRLGLKMNIEMLYLPDEMFKQKGKSLTITFGKTIPYSIFTKENTHNEWAQKVKEHVYSLPENGKPFKA